MSNNFNPTTITVYQYWAKVLRVVDGDTVDMETSLGFDLTLKMRVRLLGIDTPEIFSVKKTSEEYRKGIKSKEFLESMIPKSKWVEVKIHQSSQREKYGRWLAELFVDGVNLNKKMIEKGYAKEMLI